MVYYNKDLFDEERHRGADDVRRIHRRHGHVRREGHHPARQGRRRVPGRQFLYQLALSKADRSWVDDYQLYKGTVDFQDDRLDVRRRDLRRLGEEGLHLARTRAASRPRTWASRFISGKAPMLVSGSWWYGRFKSEINGFDWGTFLFPGTKLTLGSGRQPLGRPQGREEQGTRLRLHRHHHAPKIQNLLGNNGGVPVAADPAQITDPKNQEADRELQQGHRRGRPGVLPRLAGPRLLRRARLRLQKLINGSQDARRGARPDRRSVPGGRRRHQAG